MLAGLEMIRMLQNAAFSIDYKLRTYHYAPKDGGPAGHREHLSASRRVFVRDDATLVVGVRQEENAVQTLNLSFSMNLADVFTVVLSVAGLLTVFVGWWLAITGLFPRLVERCADRLGAAPFKSWLVGLACTLPLVVGLVLLWRTTANPGFRLFSVALVIGSLLLALAGTAGLALRIGRGLAVAADGDEQWRRVRRGGIVLAITYGTVVLLPLTLLAGLGAMVLSAISRSDKAPVAKT